MLLNIWVSLTTSSTSSKLIRRLVFQVETNEFQDITLSYMSLKEMGTVITNKISAINNITEPHGEYIEIGDINTCQS